MSTATASSSSTSGQDFHTRKDRSLKTQSDLGWQYETAGRQQICVKVIDVSGVDTTTMVEVAT